MPLDPHEPVRSAAPRPIYFYAGVFLVCSALLTLQIVQTRILSVSTWYHLAFFVISMAMFGLTAGAIYVFLRGEFFGKENVGRRLAESSIACAVSIPLSLMVQIALVTSLSMSLSTVVAFLLLAICLAVPFFFGGIVVSLCLTRSPFPVSRVYGVDLLGAGSGCLAALVLLNATDGPSAVLGVAVVVTLAASCFARSGLGPMPAERTILSALSRKRGWILGTLVVASVANGMTYHGLQPLFIKNRIENYSGDLDHLEWNSFSRIATYKPRLGDPMLWGPSRTMPQGLAVERRFMDIDGLAGTIMYRLEDVHKHDFLRYDLTNLAYFLPDRESAAIIGVGGGRDVLSAWSFGVGEIVGIEINPIFIRLLRSEPGFSEYSGLSELANVELVVDEARSWFARTDREFDLIQMSLIDTWAATGAGAFTLSENGLYTTEAWGIFLDRLSDRGVFTVSRWFGKDDLDETGRLISLAVASLLERGITEPKKHIYVASIGNIATLVLSKSPLPPPALAALHTTARKYGYTTMVTPRAEAPSPVLAEILDSRTLDELVAYTSHLPFDLTPPDDNRPFFFNQLKLSRPLEFVRMLRRSSAGVVRGNILATATLVVILIVSVLLVIATIVIPLRFSVRNVDRKLVRYGTAYFVLIGIGFMLAEIALLQRSSVFLGHPVYSLSVVLFTIITFTGLGSLLSDRWALDTPRRFTIWALLAAAYLAGLPLWMPDAFHGAEGGSLLVRIAVCIMAIAPAGLLLGFGFPTGIRLVAAVDAQATPWLWGVNGAAGVLAGGLALVIGMTFGIGSTLLIAGCCYLALIPVVRGIGWGATDA